MRRKLQHIPLALAFVAFPASMQADMLFGLTIPRNWIDGGWAAILLFGVIGFLYRTCVLGRIGGVSRRTVILCLILLCAVLFRFLVPIAYVSTPHWFPIAMEFKPLFYLVVAVAIVSADGAPRDSTLVKYAVALGAILIVETTVRSIVAFSLIRPDGSGEVNYDAALLCIGLLFGYTSTPATSLRRLVLIWTALLLTMSRTALFAAVALHLVLRPRQLASSSLVGIAALVSIVASFLIRDLSLSNLQSVDRLWMWQSALSYIASHPLSTALGHFPGVDIPVNVPPELSWLWSDQEAQVNLNGIYPFNFHAAWLRLMLTWGWVPALALTALVTYLLLSRASSNRLRGLVTISSLLALTMGLMYLSNVGVIWWLAVISIPELVRVHRRSTDHDRTADNRSTDVTAQLPARCIASRIH